MKYRRLSLDELESVRDEFVTFLIANGINAEHWEELKAAEPNLTEGMILAFSDIVWEDVLSRVKYLEHLAEGTYFVFKCDDETIHLVGMECREATGDREQFLDYVSRFPETCFVFTQSKKYVPARNTEIFRMVESGAMIVKGEWYDRLFDTHMPSDPAQ